MAGSAFVNSDPNGHGLQNNNDVVVIRLGIGRDEPGEYVVFGRVVLRNDDGDAQVASARITRLDGSDLIDRAEVRISEDSSQTIHLQGTARVSGHEIIDIRCSTFRGFVSQSSLFAIHVDRLRFD